jgi:hypothetical protein
VGDQVRFFKKGEAELVVEDLTGRFRAQVLERLQPQLIFLDVHHYRLLREAITECLACDRHLATAIHDCGRGLCNPRMTLSRDDPNVSSITGVWERHLLAEALQVEDPMSGELDALERGRHRMRIFDTTHGLAVIVPRRRIDSYHAVGHA